MKEKITKEFALEHSLYFKPNNTAELRTALDKFSNWGYEWAEGTSFTLDLYNSYNSKKLSKMEMAEVEGVSLICKTIILGKGTAPVTSFSIAQLNDDYTPPKTDSEKLTDIYNLIAALTKVVEDIQKQTAPEKTLGPGPKGPRYNGGC
jgi:hypothetical protein